MTGNEIHDGGCLCGALRYQVVGAPIWVAHCHCQSCRRASGGAVVTWVGYGEAAFTVTRGEIAYFASSPGVRRGFCATCGSPLTFQSTRWPGEVHVTVGTLDEPAAFAPTAHVFYAERLPWLHIADDARRFAGSGTGAS